MDEVLVGTLDQKECTKMPSDSSIPVVIRPNKNATLSFLCGWVKNNLKFIIEKFESDGAILFRGFEVTCPQDFEDVALLLSPQLGNDYLGTSPRTMLTKYTFTTTELPAIFPVPQHLEMSFLKRSTPEVIMFSCMNEAISGGETPICDFVKVTKEMDEKTKAKFEKKGIIHYRNYKGKGGWHLDPWQLKEWRDIFKTEDHEKVKEICDRDELVPHWDGDNLQLSQAIPAFKKHKRTGETVWANHSDVFHTSQAKGEYGYIAPKTGKLFDYFMWIILVIATFFRVLLIAPEKQAMNTTYGDKTLIKDEELAKVRKVIWKNLVAYEWRKGDIILLDNQRVSHGRLPFTGNRKVACAWGDAHKSKK
eukprot:gene8711-657_t